MGKSLLFADLSSNNNEFDAVTYRNAGHVFIAIKATEGEGFVNPDHRTWCLRAHQERIGVMHYHFARPDLSDVPEHEAAFFLRFALPNLSGRDYLCVDMERGLNGSFARDPEWTSAFDRYIIEHTHLRTILYANRSTLEISDHWLVNDRKRVWDADWSSGPDFAPAGYDCAFRQFTDGVFGPLPHGLPGVGQCDVNALRGRQARWILNHSG